MNWMSIFRCVWVESLEFIDLATEFFYELSKVIVFSMFMCGIVGIIEVKKQIFSRLTKVLFNKFIQIFLRNADMNQMSTCRPSCLDFQMRFSITICMFYQYYALN